MITRFFIVSFFIFCLQEGWSQSLLHSKPLEFNAGFVGNKKVDRISFHFNEISANSRNAYFSYDRLVKPLKGGLGFYANRKRLFVEDNSAFSSIKNDYLFTKVGIAYSPKFILKQKILLSPSVVLSYDKFDYQRVKPLDETDFLLLNEYTLNVLGAKIGILINNKNGYLGYTLDNQFTGVEQLKMHSIQAGYVLNLDKKINFIIDGVYNHGSLLDNYWRSYTKQLNLAYQYGVLFMGAGVNDYRFISGMIGLKLINLKVNMAYHFISPNHFSDVELGIQYVFDKNNTEKIHLPLKKWLLKMKM